MRRILPLLFVCSLFFMGSLVAKESKPDPCLARINGETSYLDGDEECDIPASLEETQGGFDEAPVVTCPRPSKYYSDLFKSS